MDKKYIVCWKKQISFREFWIASRYIFPYDAEEKYNISNYRK